MAPLLKTKDQTEDSVMFFKEKCWIIKGFKTNNHYVGVLSYQGEGDVASVGFDWTKSTSKKVLGFYHTHPSGLQGPSTRDDRTMGALVRAEGRPLLCGILTAETNNCYLYRRAKDRSIECIKLSGVKMLGKKVFIC